jgi:hypothetical protein
MRTRAIFVVTVVSLALVVGCGEDRAKPTSPPTPQTPEQTTQQPAPTTAPRTEEQAPRQTGVKDFQMPSATTTYDLAGEKRVVIGNPYGHIVVNPGGTKVVVKKEVYARGASESEARKKAGGFELVRKQDEAGALHLEVEGDPKDYDVGVNLMVTVPPTVTLKVLAVEGTVRVGDMQGSVEVEASANDVTVGRVKGEVKASTAAGNVDIKGAGNGLLAQTSSGSVSVINAQGESVIARTMSGPITLQVTRATKLIVTTMSGPADISVAQPFSGNGEVRSASGDLVVAIPASSNCQVRTMTGRGAIKVSLPLKEEKHEGINIRGRLGAGKGLLLVTNDSGGIEVKPK